MKGSLASFLENTGHPEHTRSRYSPETPMTEFEDTPVFPEEISPNIPNILVLSIEGNQAAVAGWSSTTSTLPSYSQNSNKSASTVTSATISRAYQSY
jgi:hypothetical protein